MCIRDSGTAIGARSQGAKTYLERTLDTFIKIDGNPDELIKAGVEAISQSLRDEALTVDNLSIAIVGKDTPFTIYDGEAVAKYI